MPRHGAVQAVMEDGEVLNLIMDVDLVRTPLPFVKEYMIKRGVFPGCEAVCERCEHCSNGCENLKAGIQCLIDDGQLQFDQVPRNEKVDAKVVSMITIPYSPIVISAPTKPVPLAVTKPGPLPYESDKVVPWHYRSDVYYHGVNQEDVSSSTEKGDVLDVYN